MTNVMLEFLLGSLWLMVEDCCWVGTGLSQKLGWSGGDDGKVTSAAEMMTTTA